MSNEIELNAGSYVDYASLRTQDLLPEFLNILNSINAPEYEQLMSSPFGPIPAYAMEDQDSEWWDSEDASFLMDELIDVLNNYVPEGHYFGAHEGNGSDFGVWISMDH